MKQLSAMIVVLSLLSLPLVAAAQQPDAVSLCDKTQLAYFTENQNPLFDQYTDLREQLLTDENADLPFVWSELNRLQLEYEETLLESPNCLNHISLEMMLAVSNMQTALMYSAFSQTLDDPESQETFHAMSVEYLKWSEAHYNNALTMMEGWDSEIRAVVFTK